MKIISLLICLFTVVSWSQEQSTKIILDNNTSLEMYREPFVAQNHEIKYTGNSVISIDNIPVFGADGGIPKFTLSGIVLKIGSRIYNLQVDNMYNPWFGEVPEKRLFKIIHNGENYPILKAQFSDGAGSYAAEWLIEWGSSIRQIITRDEELIESYFEK